jgi:hypothetical protein
MYLTMTQQDYEEVVSEAPKIVAKRMGLSDNLDKSSIMGEIGKIDPLAAGLLETFIKVYTEWYTTSYATIQGEPNSEESVNAIHRLIHKRGQMRSALISYLSAQYPPTV